MLKFGIPDEPLHIVLVFIPDRRWGGKLNKAANALPEAARRAEDQLRRAFYAEMGALLSSMGAVPALRAPKKLREDAGACLR